MDAKPGQASGTRLSAQGFTIMELMFVLLIISILMVIAIPAYQGYVARAQMAEALTLSDGLKSTVGEICNLDSTCSKANSPEFGLPAAGETSGRYVSSVTVHTGRIQATMRASPAAASRVANGQVWLVPVTGGYSIDWFCSSDIDDKYLPRICKSDG
jgi:type IV pilus assembly protein PilA